MTDEEIKTGKRKSFASVALKDHVLFAPPLIPEPIRITKGDPIPDVPEQFISALITEGVLKGK